MQFKKAVKRDAKLRLALCGPAGSGKTYSLLTVATGLGGPIAFVDTEHGSASKYADLFAFDVIEPEVFDPRQLIDLIASAAAANYKVVCIDSLSHYWMGKGGELEMVDGAAKRSQSGNSFTAWKTVTPIHNKLVDTLISAPIHVLVSMRTKTEWVIEKDDKGKQVPRKIGMAPVMRDGIEYEFDVCGDLDQDNTLMITKSRCPALTGQVINRPGAGMAATLKEWLSGAPDEPRNIAPAPADFIPSGSKEAAAAVATDKIAKLEAAAKVEAPVNLDAGDAHLRICLRRGADTTLAAFNEMKQQLYIATGGSHDTYYRVLREHGYEHANQLIGKVAKEWLAIYRAMGLALQDAKFGVSDADALLESISEK